MTLMPVPITFIGQAGKEIADSVAKGVISGLSEELAEKVDSLANRLTNSKSFFKVASIEQLRTVFQKLEDFSFLSSPEVRKKLKEAQTVMNSLGSTPHTALNENLKTSQQKIVKGMQAVLEDLTKEVKKDAGGRYRRSIQV